MPHSRQYQKVAL